MVKVYGPAMSLSASGTLANTIVFSNWKGRSYVRERVIPANPQSGPQTGLRAMMKFLAQNWAALSASDKADWQNRADQLVASPFNAFVSYNQKRWRNFQSPSILDPAAEVMTNPGVANISATGGVRQVTVQMDSNGAGDGWAIAIYRDTAGAPTPAFSNCIAVILFNAAATFAYVDTPLVPDTYHYHLETMTEDGVKTDVAFEFNGTST